MTNRGSPITSGDIRWNYFVPPDTSAKCLLLNTGAVATLGHWGTGEGLLGWYPLPKRDMDIEDQIKLDKENL